MGEGISREKSRGGRTIFVFGLLAALILIAYVIYSGVGISKENAVKGALLTLQKAQVDFHRLDHDGDGYLEYAVRLHDLGPSKDGKRPGLITPALAAACDEDATEDLYGYRFRAAKGVVRAGKPIAYSVDSDGNGTLDDFGVIALPIKPTPEQNVVYYIAETGKPWAVDMTKETTPPPLMDYLSERR
jgi:hypothetical protein